MDWLPVLLEIWSTTSARWELHGYGGSDPGYRNKSKNVQDRWINTSESSIQSSSSLRLLPTCTKDFHKEMNSLAIYYSINPQETVHLNNDVVFCGQTIKEEGKTCFTERWVSLLRQCEGTEERKHISYLPDLPIERSHKSLSRLDLFHFSNTLRVGCTLHNTFLFHRIVRLRRKWTHLKLNTAVCHLLMKQTEKKISKWFVL